jgi:hypothetical protein
MRLTFSSVLVTAAGVLLTTGLPSHAAAASDIGESGRTSIVIRTYTQPASAGEMRTARRTASAILEGAGIQAYWLECALPGAVTADPPEDPCTKPLRRNELLVRIVTAGAVDRRRHADTLGFAFVDVDAGGGSLATVYADRVASMAQDAGIDTAELLGRTMAHEVGHLLLGTNQHAPHGLMRASWSGAELRRNRATQWRFGGEEAAVMRKGLATRVPAI